jgi:hypothetical protein
MTNKLTIDSYVAAGLALLLSSATAYANISISNKPTQNMSCDTGVCTATAQKAVLNVSDLQTMLASGDVTVKTGSVAKDINIDKPLTWASTSRLTLNAQQSVVVKRAVRITGAGAVTVTINEGGGKRGEFAIVPRRGSVQFWDLSSSLIIDGNSYTLVGDIKTLAKDIKVNPRGFYALAKQYDASADGPYSDTPVKGSFNGIFEGLGNAITNLTFSLTGFYDVKAGLFHEVDAGGSIRDLALVRVNLNINASDVSAGAVAELNEGLLLRVHTTGKITASGAAPEEGLFQLGGLVGANSGLISKSSTDMQIVIGFIYDGSVGGLAAFNEAFGQPGTIDQSYSDTRIVGADSSEVGGLLADNEGNVSNSYSTQQVRATRRNGKVGGLIGMHSSGSVSTSYSVGEVRAHKGAACGGLVGRSHGSVSQSYWDSDTSRCGGAGSALTDNEFKSHLPDGFDPKIWGSDPKINNGYPYLLANPPQ